MSALKTILAACSVLLTGLHAVGNAHATSAPPNIIFVMADDLGYGDLGCYGQKLIKTPNIDALAAEGILFTQAYAGGPVCTPSRSVLMTGLHNGHTPARDNIPHYHTYLQDQDVTVAEVLSDCGYRCGGVGKWSLGDAATVGRATNQGFDTWFGYLNQDHAHFYYTEYLDDDEGRLELTGNSKSRRHYSHDLLTQRALEFIKANRDGPFFLYAAYTLPHFSSGLEDADKLAVPSTAPYSNEDWDAKTKKYAAMVHRLDRDVGRIAALLDELGLADDTLIIFTSDNGGNDIAAGKIDSNGPLRGFKRDLTEGGIRVPFIARWPGKIPAGTRTDELVAFWDVMPTLAELAGVEPPPHSDGISFVDALLGGRIEQPYEYLYWDYGHCRRRYDQAVRMGKWKGIRWGRGSELELYDLEQDLAEQNNVAASHADVVQRIEQIMEQAAVPSDRYQIGKLYTGKAIWQRDTSGQAGAN